MQHVITANVATEYIPSSMLGELNGSECDVSTRDFDLSTVKSHSINLH